MAPFTDPPVWRCSAAVLCVFVFLLEGASADALQVTDLQTPYGFLADASGDEYFISNVNGEPEVKDNNGFITKLDPSGKVLKLRFIAGGEGNTTLHAPKGMAIVDRILYVTDLDTVRGFDKRTGKPALTVSFNRYAGTSLADLAYDGHGLLYASDTEANTIYRIDTTRQYAITVLVQDASLAGPRGLAVHPKTGNLIVGSWLKGKILEVKPDGTVTELVSNSFFSSRFNNLDGIDFDSQGNMYVSDFTGGKIWRMRPDRHFEVIAEFLSSPADIGVDRKNHLILVPYQYGNAAEINGLGSPARSENKKRTLADYGFTFPKPEKEGK